ncbi:MAG TPA: hypothetical protein VJA94_18715 [Candidatus Angelobacter sp.]
MEQTLTREESAAKSGDVPLPRTSTDAPNSANIKPQATASCPSCGAAQAGNQVLPPQCVYVIGHIEPRYPSLAIEKEARQATARLGATQDTDRQIMAKVLRDPGNKYLVRQLCWVLSIHGIETYILIPRDGDYQPLVDAYRAEPNPGDLELVIGTLGPVAPPAMCNGLLVPIVIFDQIYAFDRKSLLDSIPKPKNSETKKFGAASAEMFDLILGQTDNAGATDADRARNYLAVRYDRIYSLAAEQFGNNASLTSVDVVPSPLNGVRRIVDVRFVFTDRSTGVDSKFSTRVDVTECFPFLVTKMSPYYDR